MTREIKFRAWDKKTKRMSNPLSGHLWYLGEKEVVLMQYTGLKDKNGVEIYEGDILKTNEPFFASGNHVVWWGDSGMWVWGVPGEWGEGFFVDHPLYTYEVIGNIYENPELLEENDD